MDARIDGTFDRPPSDLIRHHAGGRWDHGWPSLVALERKGFFLQIVRSIASLIHDPVLGTLAKRWEKVGSDDREMASTCSFFAPSQFTTSPR